MKYVESLIGCPIQYSWGDRGRVDNGGRRGGRVGSRGRDQSLGQTYLSEHQTLRQLMGKYETSSTMKTPSQFEGYLDSTHFAQSGHLSARSDVYSFGVVLLELLTGRKSVDKSRPTREQNLADWALPMIKKKLLNIIDPRLEGDYPVKDVHKAAMLAYHCLNRNPKARPLMRDIVDSLEPLQVSVEVPVT